MILSVGHWISTSVPCLLKGLTHFSARLPVSAIFGSFWNSLLMLIANVNSSIISISVVAFRNGLLNGFLQESDVIYSQGKDVSATAQMTKCGVMTGTFSNKKINK